MKFQSESIGHDHGGRLIITSDDEQFDEQTIQDWKEEGFDVTYIPLEFDQKAYRNHLMHESDELEFGEKYGIIAYGQAATQCLTICQKPMPKLAVLVAYYPTVLPMIHTSYPSGIKVLVHQAGKGEPMKSVVSYSYKNSEPGFAETDMEEFNGVSRDLAWGRSLKCVREGFEIIVDLEKIWGDHLALEYLDKDADRAIETMVSQPYLNHIPTITGGVGHDDLYRFYREFFIPENPPSLKIRLISRTIGTDRIVDEMITSFQHTNVISWILPGVDPTDKWVEIAMVSIVQIRGGKLSHEHVYWDQASVLVQIGLLDPETKMKNGNRLPIWGKESTEKVLDKDCMDTNALIEEWWTDEEEEEDGDESEGEEEEEEDGDENDSVGSRDAHDESDTAAMEKDDESRGRSQNRR